METKISRQEFIKIRWEWQCGMEEWKTRHPQYGTDVKPPYRITNEKDTVYFQSKITRVQWNDRTAFSQKRKIFLKTG